MQLNFGRHRSQTPRAFSRAGWVMLLLAVHAFVVGATHLHAGDRLQVNALAPPGVSVGEHEDYKHHTANEHVRCLLCRLQRGLVADLEGVRPFAFAPSPESALAASPARPLFLDNSTHAPSGRAPPPA
ncbi:MAG TPA: hypothetical protein VEQ42_13025 [Pyrinomonadaceae bacterium]|nr:hypothetical protein [Pyrinomonadaceae bacterium]